MTKGKRPVEEGGDEEELACHPKRPRVPVLSRVVVEALQNYKLQRLFTSVEPIIRRVVSEEVERALAKVSSGINGRPRNFPKQIEGPGGRNLQLRFTSAQPVRSMFTGQRIEGENGADVHVLLVDAATGDLVSSGTEASAKLNVLVLDGGFDYQDSDDWTEEEFQNHVVRERPGKRPLLVGELQVSLNEGIGTLGELCFTDNSKWTRRGKFRLAVKVAAGCCSANARIREAVTVDFVVKEGRGQSYMKLHPPALEDEVWRLECIAKGGIFHQKLKERNVHTVGDFLKSLLKNRDELRDIIGSSMSEKNWKKLEDHAKTASLSGKHYICYSDETKNVSAIFDDKFAFIGLIEGDLFIPRECFDGDRQYLANSLINKAYGNWHDLLAYQGNDLLGFIKIDRAATASSSSQFHLGNAVIAGDSAFGVDDVTVNPAPMPSVSPPADSSTHLQNEIGVSGNEIGDFAPPAPIDDAAYEQQMQQDPNQSPCLELDYLSDEIRSMLEDDRMQSCINEILRNEGSSDPEWPGYLNLESEREPSPPRRAEEWVKITAIAAAMRWAFFIRRRAAGRRRAPQIVELQD